MIHLAKVKCLKVYTYLLCRNIAFNGDDPPGLSGFIRNKHDIELFGHPRLVSVPNQVTGRQLSKILDTHIPEALDRVSSFHLV